MGEKHQIEFLYVWRYRGRRRFEEQLWRKRLQDFAGTIRAEASSAEVVDDLLASVKAFTNENEQKTILPY